MPESDAGRPNPGTQAGASHDYCGNYGSDTYDCCAVCRGDAHAEICTISRSNSCSKSAADSVAVISQSRREAPAATVASNGTEARGASTRDRRGTK